MARSLIDAPIEHPMLTYQRTAGNLAVSMLVQRQTAEAVPPPDYLVPFTFLGRACGKGVNPTLRDRLAKVEAHLKSRFDSLPDEQKTKPDSTEPAANYIEWLGVKETHIGWRHNAGLHASGSAVDIAIHTNPYIATRTDTDKGPVMGGEKAGAGLPKQRADAVAAYDEALRFTRLSAAAPVRADVGIRTGTGANSETTAHVFERFKATSNALAKYLSFAFHNFESVQINRPPVPDLDSISDDELFKRIPPSERRQLDEAVSDIRAFIATDEFSAAHPDGPFVGQERDIYFQMLRNYERVRIPMVYGDPSATPASTRNPLLGFLSLREELVTALADIGQLRWGAADFGAAESGDIQHFDLGYDAFPPA
jgi:hypothetical protein